MPEMRDFIQTPNQIGFGHIGFGYIGFVLAELERNTADILPGQ